LGIATVAESVETAAVLGELERLGVDFVQGYYLARPRPLGELDT
jgi:EAL domain-containing protein (putative c-di-GMP-specific phosphodiesterase class I)